MKQSIIRRPKALVLLFSVLAASAQGGTALDISGGDGSVLGIRLPAPVRYTVTHGSIITGKGPVFIFNGVASGAAASGALSGDMTFSVNGAGSYPITSFSTGTVNEDATADDLLIYGNLPTLNPGDVIMLNPGTLTSATGVTSTFSGGTTETFLADGSAMRISSPDTVPEPTVPLLLGLGAASLVLLRRRAV